VTVVARLIAALDRFPGVEQRPSRFAAHRPAWSIAGREFAHLHTDDVIDLRLSRAKQALLRGDPRARFRGSPSAWVELEFHSASDVAHVVAIAHDAWLEAKQQNQRG